MAKLQLISILSLLAHTALSDAAGQPEDRMSKIIDFCNGTCPSTPGPSGKPRQGQDFFPSMTVDSSGNFYILKGNDRSGFYHVQLNCFTAEGKTKWTFNPIETFDPIDNPYWLQLGKDAIYIHSSSCCAPDGSSKERIWKVSMDGTYISMRDTVGAATLGPDGTIYTLVTPDSAKGPVSYLRAMDQNGTTLWKYTDGVSRMTYVMFGPNNALCMPSYTDKAGSVVCVDMKSGQQVYKQEVTDSPYESFDLLDNGWNLYIRKSRDNSYRHAGKTELYPFIKENGNNWTFTFPDDVDLVGSTAYAAGGALVLLTRPECRCRPDSLIAVGPDGSMHWNATLPGEGDVSVNPAYAPLLGPWSLANDLIITSTVKTLHADNKTNDMWYSAIKEGKLVWKLPFTNVTDFTRMTYSANAAGDFFMIKDGVLWKIAAAAESTETKSIFV